MVEAGTFHPLFLTGVARSGSNLLCRMLGAHPDVVTAADPFLIFFRWLRNAIVQERAGGEAVPGFDPAAPLQDYYFSDAHIAVMDAIQSSDMNVEFDESRWGRFHDDCRERTTLECADLAEHLDALRAGTYAAMMDRALRLIARVRGGERCRWVGFKDLWIVEFFKPLARSMPEARFIVIRGRSSPRCWRWERSSPLNWRTPIRSPATGGRLLRSRSGFNETRCLTGACMC